MIKRLAACVREYKKPTILTLIFIVGEAFIETFIPFITARLVNLIKYGAPMIAVTTLTGSSPGATTVLATVSQSLNSPFS